MEQKDNIKNIQIFSGNSKSFYIYKKTEKLVSAIYLITNHISDNEPLKWSLRETGACLLKDIFHFVSTNIVTTFAGRVYSIDNTQALFLKLISYLEILHISGQISDMNFSIVSSEFKNLLSVLDHYHNDKTKNNGVVFPDEFFTVSDISNSSKGHNTKGQTKDIKDRSSVLRDTPENEIARDIKDTNKTESASRGDIAVRSTGNSSDGTHGDSPILSRRESIISVLRVRGGGLTIKDFSEVIKGCSEKTIQRDLTELISDGVLKKEGERRWSKYYKI